MTDEDPGIRSDVGEDGVQYVRIDRASVGNSLSPNARDALAKVFEVASADPRVRAVLLSSAGDRHFCAGAGLTSRPESPLTAAQKRPGDVARLLQRGWQRLIGAVLDCEKPVVAAVTGTAVGAGASLVLACDLVVMAQGATLKEAFVDRGILPDSGAIHLLTRIVGLRRATEMLMLGESVDAARCLDWGLVNRVTRADQAEDVAADIARRLASGPSVMLAMTKRLLSVSSESDRARAFEQEAWAAEVVSNTSDLAEGLRAFAERRPPRFEGR